MLRLIVLAAFLAGNVQGRTADNAGKNQLQFTITKTWDGRDVAPQDQINLTLEGVEDSKDVQIRIRAPYYDDPAPNAKPGEAYRFIWRHEDVEAFFLNDQDHYTQVLLGPNGQYSMAFFNGSKKNVVRSLPLDVNVTIEGETWTGLISLPGNFLPSKVTKFNAASMHGVGSERKYLQLYPTGSGVTQRPDFHLLSSFQPIQMSTLSPAFNDDTSSTLWEFALRGETLFTIHKTWKGEEIPKSDQVQVALKKAANIEGVLVNIRAPFYNNSAPDAAPGERSFGLWKHETVELFFLNRDEQYIQVQVASQGQYIVLLFNGRYNYINHELPLNITHNIQGAFWTAEFVIPTDYFPPGVTKFSAAAQHNLTNERRFLTLTPSPTNPERADFHNVAFYQVIDLSHLIEVDEMTLSPIWNSALKREFEHMIQYSWRRKDLPKEDQVKLIMTPIPNSKDVALRIEAPFYDDAAPVGRQGSLDLAMYRHEIVEVYFANSDGQYLQIEVGPRAHYIVLLYNGERNLIRHSLPLNVTTIIGDNMWKGEFIIPFEYFPPQVSKFNGDSMHGNGTDRQYNTLTLCNPKDTAPDFHRLESFRVINLEHLNPALAQNPLSSIWDEALAGEYRYTIQTTWDGKRIPSSEEVNIVLKRDSVTKDILVKIESPFYAGPPLNGKSLRELWRHEVVEVYFSNDNELYLQVQFSPYGEYLVILFNGKRNTINRGLPLDVATSIEGMKWITEATIPTNYLPPKVRKFSAAAIHGEGAERRFLSLSPDPTAAEPDFHNIPFFQYIDTRGPLWKRKEDATLSPLWTSSLRGEFPFTIEKTWDGKTIPEMERYVITLKGDKKSKDVSLSISAPYYDDPSPKGEPGPIWGLWNHEEVEVYFLNDQDQYLQIIIGPHGHYIVLLQDGVKNPLIWSLPLNLTNTIQGTQWFTEVTIPGDYFPPQVTHFNAFAIHGAPNKRQYLALYPTDGSTEKPDFHAHVFFRPIDMALLNSLFQTDIEYSATWTSALNKV